MRKKIGVLFGGKSVEHEISIISAVQAMENMDRNKYDIIPLYVSKVNKIYSDADLLLMDTYKELNNVTNPKNEIYLEKANQKVLVKRSKGNVFKNNIVNEIDIFFLIVHGTNVEDGALSGFASLYNIPVIGPSVLSGAIGQDKAVMKDILKANNIAQTEYFWIYDNIDYEKVDVKIMSEFGYPVIIKPASLGSSIGIEIAKNKEELYSKLDESFKFDKKIVIEEFLEKFKEVNISLMGNYKDIKFSSTEEVNKDGDILSYEDKYISNGKGKNRVSGMASLSRIIPASIEDEMVKKIKNLTKNVFNCLNVTGVVRMDLMIVGDVVYLNEINNIPGSLSFYLWENNEYNYQKLIDDLVELSIKIFFDEEKKTMTIDTNVLNIKGKKNE